MEANMPFSLSSYLIGVGTVVGALVFGFGGGVVLTHTAMNENPAGQTRVERVARAEPEAPAAPQVQAGRVAPTPNQAAVAPNQVTTPEQDHPASVAAIKQDAAPVERPAAIPPDSVPAAQAGPLKPDAARQPEPETPRPTKQAAREPRPPKQVEQTGRMEAKHVESRETDRSTERLGRYAASSMRQRRLVVQEEPAQEVVVSRPPEQQHLDLFGGLFGRPADATD
jgi:hypothetical protein